MYTTAVDPAAVTWWMVMLRGLILEGPPNPLRLTVLTLCATTEPLQDHNTIDLATYPNFYIFLKTTLPFLVS